jgi:S-layer protein
MATDVQTEMTAQRIADSLNMRLYTPTAPVSTWRSYGSSNELYLEVKPSGSIDALIKFQTEPMGAGSSTSVGASQPVFTPHRIQIALPQGIAATGEATLASVLPALHATGTATLSSVNAVAAATGTATLSSVNAAAAASGTATLVSVNAAAAASGTATLISVNAAAAASGTATLVSVNAAAAASGTATLVDVVAGNKLTIAGVDFTAVAADPGANEFVVGDGPTKDNDTATNLATAINASTSEGVAGVVTATPSTNTVIVAADASGVLGNTITFTKTGDPITVTGSGTLEGGLDACKLNINGVDFTAVAADPGANEFIAAVGDNDTAINLAAAINDSVSVGVADVVTATPSTNTVVITADAAGVLGNAITFIKTGDPITVTGSGTLEGGLDACKLTINGVDFTAVSGASGSNEFVAGSDNDTATNLATAINASISEGVAGVVTATPSTNTVVVTADAAGVAGNSITFTKTGDPITVTGSGTLEGGLDACKLTINGVDFTAVAAAPGANEFLITGTDDEDAIALATAINASISEGVAGVVTATPSTNTVVVTADASGVAGNSITFTKIGDPITVTGSGTLEGGLDACKLTINGVDFTAVSSAPGADEFLITGTDNEDAIALAAAINASTSEGVADVVTATPSTNTVVITAEVVGVVGNVIPFTKTGDPITVTGSGTLEGGTDLCILTVAGVNFTAVSGAPGANEFAVGVDDDATAVNLAAAINASTSEGVADVVTASANLHVVTITADDYGTAGNSITLAETGDGITISGNNLANGRAPEQLVVNGVAFSAVDGNPGANEFLVVDGKDDTTATNLMTAINASVSTGVAGVVTATSSDAVVTVKAVQAGLAGNSITLTEVGNSITLDPATGFLAGGTATGNTLAVSSIVIAECARYGMTLDIYSDESISAATFDDLTKRIATIPHIFGIVGSV